MDQNNMELDNVIVLSDENGNALEFEFVDSLEYEGAEYVLLLPTDEESEDVVILQSVADEEDEEMVNFITVENVDVLEAVYDLFKEKLQDEYDFE